MTWRRVVSAGPVLAILVGLLATPLVYAPAAHAEECTPLEAAALAFDARLLEGSLPSGGRCWTLPVADGDVVQVGTMYGYPTVTVLDPSGPVPCDEVAGSDSSTCRLSGPGPFSLQVTGYTDDPYSVQAARLNDATGCGTLPAFTFGTSSPLSVPLTERPFTCFTGQLRAGRHLTFSDGYADLALRNGDATKVCSMRWQTYCTVTAGGSHNLVVTKAGGEKAETALYPLDSDARGCDASLDLDWSTPAARLGPQAPKQANCHQLLGAVPGNRVDVSRHYEVSTEVVDSNGEPACVDTDELVGCELKGTAPYRVISWGPGEYPLAVRDVSTWKGCPVITPTDLGSAPAQPVEGISCRVLEPETTGPHLTSLSGTSAKIYDATGAQLCPLDDACMMEAGRRYAVFAGQYNNTFVAAFHRLDSTGCADVEARIDRPWAGHIEAHQLTCAQLALPAGARLAAYARSGAYLDVYDATGKQLCGNLLYGYDRSCALNGPAPFRAIAVADEARDYAIAFHRLDAPIGCESMAGGRWGTTEGATVSLPAGQFAACLTTSRSSFGSTALVAYDRLSGAGDARLIVRDEEPGACVVRPAQHGSTVCRITEPTADTISAVLLSDGTASTWRVIRRPIGSTTGCRTITSTGPTAPVLSGSLDGYLDIDCYRLAAESVSDQFHVNLHGPSAEAALEVFNPQGWKVCEDHGSWECQLGGEVAGYPSYQLVVRERGFEPPGGAYDLSVLKGNPAGRPAEGCPEYADFPKGFGPVTGKLSDSRPFACFVVEKGDLRVSLTSTTGSTALPRPHMLPASALGGDCTSESVGVYSCRQQDPDSGDPLGRGLLVLHRPDGVEQVSFSLSVDCAARCGPHRVPPTVRPVIKGRVAVDQTISVTAGSWDFPASVVRYRWFANGVGLPGANGSSLKLTSALLGKRISARVVATPGSTAWVGASVTTAVTVARGAAPVARTRPVMLGTRRVGSRLTATNGSWSKAPSSYRYRWYVGGKATNLTAKQIRLTRAMLGKRVYVKVFAARTGCVTGISTAKAITVRR